MLTYYGFKEIKAREMTRQEFADYMQSDKMIESPEDEGYLVEYVGSPISNHPDHKNYISWSPRAVFEAAYVQVDDQSLEAIMVYFEFSHLPEHLRRISKPMGFIAKIMDSLLSRSPEKSAGLRKLLEAKDCFVRARL